MKETSPTPAIVCDMLVPRKLLMLDYHVWSVVFWSHVAFSCPLLLAKRRGISNDYWVLLLRTLFITELSFLMNIVNAVIFQKLHCSYLCSRIINFNVNTVYINISLKFPHTIVLLVFLNE